MVPASPSIADCDGGGVPTSVELLEKPTRPLSAYNLFFRDEREMLIQALPPPPRSACNNKNNTKSKARHHYKISFADLAKEISSRWKQVDTPTKGFYEQQAAAGRVRYHEKAEAWRKQRVELGLPYKRKNKKSTDKKDTASTKKQPKKQETRSSHIATVSASFPSDDLEPIPFYINNSNTEEDLPRAQPIPTTRQVSNWSHAAGVLPTELGSTPYNNNKINPASMSGVPSNKMPIMMTHPTYALPNYHPLPSSYHPNNNCHQMANVMPMNHHSTYCRGGEMMMTTKMRQQGNTTNHAPFAPHSSEELLPVCPVDGLVDCPEEAIQPLSHDCFDGR